MENKTISHFRIIRKLNEGGMGEIFLAEDTDLHRMVILKRLPPHLTSNQELIGRFKREAQAAAALKHPNIVTVYELFKDGDKFYMAMEYIEGTCLMTLLEKKEFSIRKAMLIGIQICRGLRKAHGAGIIHRDIKPSNIMIDKDGWVKVLDFGLAKLNDYSKLTHHGVRMGTVRYISPEQLRGEELRVSSDIFSLGVVLYELVTGYHPFEGKTEEEVIYSIIERDATPMSHLRPGVPSEFQRAIAKALRKDPAKRYQKVNDFLVALKKAKKHYIAQRKSAGKKGLGDTVTLVIRDLDTKRIRIRWVSAMILFRAKLRAMKRGKSLFFILPLLIAMVIAVPLFLANFESRHLLTDVEKRDPIRVLSKEKKSMSLKKTLAEFRSENLISVGDRVDFTSLEDCYLFIIDHVDVLDVFAITENMFHSLNTKEEYSAIPNKYSGKTKIWIQDLTKVQSNN
jgi:serine/threonine protein kinase